MDNHINSLIIIVFKLHKKIINKFVCLYILYNGKIKNNNKIFM